MGISFRIQVEGQLLQKSMSNQNIHIRTNLRNFRFFSTYKSLERQHKNNGKQQSRNSTLKNCHPTDCQGVATPIS